MKNELYLTNWNSAKWNGRKMVLAFWIDFLPLLHNSNIPYEFHVKLVNRMPIR